MDLQSSSHSPYPAADQQGQGVQERSGVMVKEEDVREVLNWFFRHSVNPFSEQDIIDQAVDYFYRRDLERRAWEAFKRGDDAKA